MDWPPLPAEMELELLQLCNNHPDEPALIAKYPDLTFFHFTAPDYLKQWVYQNISDITEEYNIELQVWKHAEHGNRHIDRKREHSYNYLLMEHPGITRWFEDDGTLIESVNYKPKKWYKHIGSVKYHDVINANYFRPALTIYKRIDPLATTDTRPQFWKEK